MSLRSLGLDGADTTALCPTPELTTIASEAEDSTESLPAPLGISKLVTEASSSRRKLEEASPSPIPAQRVASSEQMDSIPVMRVPSDQSVLSEALTDISVDQRQPPLVAQGSATAFPLKPDDIGENSSAGDDLSVDTVGNGSSLFSRGGAMSKMTAPFAVAAGGAGRVRMLASNNSGELSYGGKSTRTDASSESSTQYTTQSYTLPTPAKSRLPSSSEQPTGASVSEKQRRALEKTLCNRPKPLEAQRILVMKAARPHVSVIVDKPVTLKPGTELFTFRVGPLTKEWRPFGYDEGQSCAHVRQGTGPLAGEGEEKGAQEEAPGEGEARPVVLMMMVMIFGSLVYDDGRIGLIPFKRILTTLLVHCFPSILLRRACRGDESSLSLPGPARVDTNRWLPAAAADLSTCEVLGSGTERGGDKIT